MDRVPTASEDPAGRNRGGLVEGRKQVTADAVQRQGGFASGLARASFSIRWASDKDKHACATFRHRFPGVPLVEKDVSELSVQADDLAPVQILAAGFPCQSFSQAGGRLGFEDPRGALFFEIPRLIEEYEPDERLRWSSWRTCRIFYTGLTGVGLTKCGVHCVGRGIVQRGIVLDGKRQRRN